MASNDRRLVTTDDSHSSFPRPWRFVASVPSIASLPPEGPIEVAFVGRSNVGKSSLINALVGQNALARTSNTPGRTQTLNFFVPDDGAEHPNLAIVDMPGYGYAKAPKKAVEAWTGLIRAYLKGRAPLRRVFVLVDSRHGLKPADTAIMDALDKAAVSYQIVLTKADKITPGALDARIAETAGAVVRRAAAHPEVLATSSTRGLGLDSLQLTILDLAAAR